MQHLLQQTGVYCIRNLRSGRIYVGSAICIGARWRKHRSRLNAGTHHSEVFQRSWNKHGQSVFRIEILELTDSAYLIDREQFWIDRLSAADPNRGLNRSPTAGNTSGMRGYRLPTRTPEHCEKLRIIALTRKGQKKKPQTPEHRAKIGIANKGRKSPRSEETKAKISASLKLFRAAKELAK